MYVRFQLGNQTQSLINEGNGYIIHAWKGEFERQNFHLNAQRRRNMNTDRISVGSHHKTYRWCIVHTKVLMFSNPVLCAILKALFCFFQDFRIFEHRKVHAYEDKNQKHGY